MADDTRKTCCRCKAAKPLDAFAKDRQTPDGLQRRCRECKAAENRAWRANGGAEVAAANLRRWRAENPERDRETKREWQRANPDRVREHKRRYREANPDAARKYREATQESRTQYMREWRAANPERAREIARQSKQAAYLRDPMKAIDAANRRRALIMERTVGPVDLQHLWSEQDGLCALCGDPIDRSLKWPHPMSASLDHIVPLVAGGTHEQSNLQWTHLVENLQKGATVPNPPSNAHLTEGASNAPD